MPRLALIFTLTLGSLAAVAARPVRADVRVELVFTDPGDALWTRWGHVGLRVLDPERGFDALYNYGYAPFDQPDFLWGYLRGESEFLLVAKPWEWSLERYRRWDRTVRRRPLQLPPEQRRELVRRLFENARPENAGYRYDHLRDNCSTRVRDLLDAVTGGALRAAAEAHGVGHGPRRYRDDTLRAGSGRLGLQIVFDLIGGPNQEQGVTPWGALYLPEDLERVAERTELRWGDGSARRLLGPPLIEYERRGPPVLSGDLGAGRVTVTSVGLGLGLLLAVAGVARRRGGPWAVALARLAGVGLGALALVFGVVGLVLLALAVISRIPDFTWNENLLIVWPFDLVWLGAAGAWVVRGRATLGRLAGGYTTVRLVGLAAYGVAKLAGLLPQDNWSFFGLAAVAVGGLWLGQRWAGDGSRSPATPLA